MSLAHGLSRQTNTGSARAEFVQRAETLLRRADQPRFQMSLIMVATGGVGFAVSSGLLHAGVDQMAIRYPVAVALAYTAFLGFLKLWMYYQGVRLANGVDLADVPDISISSKSGGSIPEIFKGGGGRFGGGGATAFFNGPAAPPEPVLVTSASAESNSSQGFLDIDLDDLGLVLIALAMAACAVLAGLYIIYIAPGLFAEILVDRAVMGPVCTSTSTRNTPSTGSPQQSNAPGCPPAVWRSCLPSADC